jgi:hypothetical protein
MFVSFRDFIAPNLPEDIRDLVVLIYEESTMQQMRQFPAP